MFAHNSLTLCNDSSKGYATRHRSHYTILGPAYIARPSDTVQFIPSRLASIVKQAIEVPQSTSLTSEQQPA
jgi:hypothetical protein